MAKFGFWIDGPQPETKSNPNTVEQEAELIWSTGATEAAIFLNPGIHPKWKSKWSAGKLSRFTYALRRRGVEPFYTTWLYSNERDVKAWGKALRELYANITTRGVTPGQPDLNLEPGGSRGWGRNGRHLAVLVGDQLRALPGLDEVKASVVCIPGFRGVSPQDLAVIGIDEVKTLILEAYSQYQRKKKWTHHPLMRPGPMQRHSHDLAQKIIEEGLVEHHTMGMRAGHQKHPSGPRGLEAYDVAFDTAMVLGEDTFRVWSWKWVKGRPDVISWFQALPARVPVNPHKPDTKLKTATFRGLQSALVSLGYKPGPIDGAWGPRTSAALEAFEEDEGFKSDGEPDLEVLKALLGKVA